MKTIVLTTLLLSSFFISNAQNYEYVPFVKEGLIWSYCDVVKAGGEDYKLYYYQFNFSGDTIINGIAYKKLFQRDCSSNGLINIASMREDNKKVYAVYAGKQEEKLIYNFGLVVGDSIQSPYDENLFYQVKKVDTIEVASGKRKRIELDFDIWIEGIGTLDRFMMYPLHAIPLYDLGVRINYQKQGAQINYKTNEWYLNENDCNFSSVEATESGKIIVYNIAPDLLKLETQLSEPDCTIELLDVYGKKLVQMNTDVRNTTIDLSRFPDGLYVLRISGSTGVRFTGKVMKR